MESRDARLIAGLMVFTTAIALIGHTFEVDKKGHSRLSPHVGDAQILLGGAIGAALLVGIDQLGETGAVFAKGLAIIALITVLGLYGGPAADAISNLTGQTKKPAPAPTPKKASTK